MELNPEKKILIADDDGTTRDLLREVFEEQHYVVHTVSDGLQASEWLEHERDCHVLLADLRMPHLSGLQLIQRVKKAFPQIHCVLISTLIDSELRERAGTLGIDQVFEKPVNVQQLLNCVAGLLATPPRSSSLDSNPARPL